MLKRLLKIEHLAAVAAVIVLSWLLLYKPIIGLADNGDFQRIMGTIGITYADSGLSFDDKFFKWVIHEYSLSKMGLGGYATTSLAPVLLAKGLSWLFLDGGRFDIRFVAGVYGLLLVAGIWLILRYNKRGSLWIHLLMAAFLVLIFTDVGYAGYFNSFYSEPMSLTALLLVAGFASALLGGGRHRRLLLAGYAVSALFLIGSKVQNAPIGIVLALIGLGFAGLHSGSGWKRLACSWAALLVVVSAATYFSLPRELKIINQYQTVFYGILKDSPNPKQDLKELGLSERLAVNAGTNYFEKAPIDQKDPVIAKEFYPYISHGKVVAFYLKHPGRLVKKLGVAAENGLTIRPAYLGNFEKSEGLAPGENTHAFSLWSSFKQKMLPNKLWFVAVVFVGYFYVLTRQYLNTYVKRKRLYLEGLGAIGLASLFLFVTPVLGDGEADLAKHLFGFNMTFDLMLWVSVYWLVWRGWQLIGKGQASGGKAGRQGQGVAK